VRNAIEAMTAPGELRVRTLVDDAGRPVFEVEDTGAGIAPEVMARIFDPFFTTKPIGRGTGLGLAVCHQIVAGFGGEITVRSTPGRGSTFRVVLPVARMHLTQSELRRRRAEGA
jgi:signal transduction histidine kinase